MFIATKAVDTPNGSFVNLVTATWNLGRFLVNSAYRIYSDSDKEIGELASDARRAFQTFLERYAIPYDWEGRRVYFLPVLTAEAPANQVNLPILLNLPMEQDAKWVVSADAKISDGTLTLAWPFVVNSVSYSESVTSRRR